jgi:hypothetical protein
MVRIKRHLVIFILMFCECGYSQTLGLRIGLNKTIMDGYSGNIEYYGGGISGFTETEKNHLSFNGGLVAGFPLGRQKQRLSMESGLLLKTVGKDVLVSYSSFSMSRGGYVLHTGSGSIKLWYLSIPVNARISFPAGKTRISYILGPYFNLGIGGRENGSQIIWGNSESDHIRRLDIGLSTGLAIFGNKTEAGILCSSSFRDIDPSWNSIYNRELSIYLRFNLPHKDEPIIKPIQELQIQ